MNKKLFIWIPKSSGTSFYESFRLIDPTFIMQLNCNKITNGTHGHCLVTEIYSDKELCDFEIFTIVRNPFSRAVSLYEYLKKQNLFPKNKNFESFLSTIHNGVPSVGPYNRKGLSQCNPQKDWIKDVPNVKIYRLEKRNILERDFALPQKHANRSVYSDYRLMYDHNTIEMVKEIYKEDFTYFNYSTELV